MNKFRILIKVLPFLICAAISNCSNDTGNALVTINTGLNDNKIEIKGTPPENITSISLTVDGEGMAPIKDEIDKTTGSITLEVPSGNNRIFTVYAECSDSSSYLGTTSVNLNSGENTTILITMNRQNTQTALIFSELPAETFNYTQGTYLLGFEFKATSAISITKLGYYDSTLLGTQEPGGSFSPTDVGLYNMSTHTLIGSVTVTASDPSATIFRYATLAKPVTLNTTDTYAVVAVTGTDYYVSNYIYESQANAALTWVGFAYHGVDGLTQTSVLLEPDWFPKAGSGGNIGPNFIFVMN